MGGGTDPGRPRQGGWRAEPRAFQAVGAARDAARPPAGFFFAVPIRPPSIARVISGLAEKNALNHPAPIISSNDCVLLTAPQGAPKHLFARTREQLPGRRPWELWHQGSRLGPLGLLQECRCTAQPTAACAGLCVSRHLLGLLGERLAVTCGLPLRRGRSSG